MTISPRFTSFLLWLNGLSAIYGGGYLLGGANGMDPDLLSGSPFDGYAIPGAILLIVIGGSSTLAAAMRLGKHPRASQLSLIAGIILAIWLLVEVFIVPEYWPAQVFYGLVAVLIIIGAWQELRGSPAS